MIYTYPISDTPNNAVDPERLFGEIEAEQLITPKCIGVSLIEPDFRCDFAATLNNTEVNALEALISIHSGSPIPAEADLVKLDEPRTPEGVVAMAPSYMMVNETYRNDGHRFTALAGQDTYYDTVVSNNLVYLRGASFWVEETSVIGDFMEFSVIDKDDVLGMFAQYGLTQGVDILELTKYVRRHYLPPRGSASSRVSHWDKMMPGTVAPIVGGLYMRTRYHSVGTADVEIINHYEWFES